jgi:hypothetical protein
MILLLLLFLFLLLLINLATFFRDFTRRGRRSEGDLSGEKEKGQYEVDVQVVCLHPKN